MLIGSMLSGLIDRGEEAPAETPASPVWPNAYSILMTPTSRIGLAHHTDMPIYRTTGYSLVMWAKWPYPAVTMRRRGFRSSAEVAMEVDTPNSVTPFFDVTKTDVDGSGSYVKDTPAPQ